MIVLLGIVVLAFIGAGCTFLALCLFAGVFHGIFENLVWLWKRAHGAHPVPPWRKLAARRTQNYVRVPAEVRARVMARDGFACVYCGAESDLTVDHVIPRVVGGSNDPSNLVTACRPCNSSKGTGVAPHPHRDVRRSAIMLWRAERFAARNGNGRH